MLQLQYILVYLCIVICIEICNSFSFDAYHTQNIGKIHSHNNNNPSHLTSFVRHYQSTQTRSQYTTIQLWNTSPITKDTDNDISNTQDDEDVSNDALSDLHSSTIAAISNGLYIRSQSNPKMPLRYIDNGSMEEWEVTFTAGKIAQGAADEYMVRHNLNPKENEDDEELLQVMAGRVVAVLVRLDELEDALLKRCSNSNNGDMSEEQRISLGIPIKELNAYKSSSPSDTAEIIDATCLFDTTIRNNRSKSLLAMFLHDIEGPGLRKNNVKIPCMDVDFLYEDVWTVLFGSNDDSEEAVESASDAAEDTPGDDSLREDDDKHQTARPSLHPITIDAIEEAFRLRAQNSTTSPLRLINDSMEWFEVQYSVVKFADRFMEMYTKNKGTSHDWTEEELQTIGGRIVGVLMRLDDLEWEWNHRITTSSLVDEVESSVWKTTFGLHPDDIEQNCILTLDTALSEEEDFARIRAERMLALFLLNVEGPFVEEAMPGGSYPDFIQDELQLKLMAPKSTKKE